MVSILFAPIYVPLTAMLLAGYGTARSVQQPEPARKITETEIKSAINSRSDVEECQSLDQIYIDHVEYHDFFGDGQQEAVVVAYTCMTGTAGRTFMPCSTQR